MDTFQEDLYQKRAQIVLKLLDAYLVKQQTMTIEDLPTLRELPVLIDAKAQEPIADFLRRTLQCKVTYGKDRFGQLNGYLLVSLDNARLNQTGFYQAALALQKQQFLKR
jgi:hypothetical protein